MVGIFCQKKIKVIESLALAPIAFENNSEMDIVDLSRESDSLRIKIFTGADESFGEK